jgi:hypothetical protein
MDVTSPFDSLTAISYKCSRHITCLAGTIRLLNPSFGLSITAKWRFRPLGFVGDRQ